MILLAVASLSGEIKLINDHGKARLCHFGPYSLYREYDREIDNEAAPNKILWFAI